MKLKIGVGFAPINGYRNIDPSGGDGKEIGYFDNLDHISDNAECTEILGENCLDFIHGSQLLNTLNHLSSKLRHKGKLVLGGSDIIQVSKAVANGQLSLQDYNKTVFGLGDNPWMIKQGMYNCNDIVNILTELGLKIRSKSYLGYEFIVEAYRD